MRSALRKILGLVGLAVLLATVAGSSASAQEPLYALNVYGGKLTSNHWDEFVDVGGLDFIDSRLLTVGLTRRVGGYRDLLSYEIEGQLVKHFGLQDHWEFNALAAGRWEKFWWDKVVDTSFAFGLGPSFASETPKAEVLVEGKSQPWMVYWMMELAFGLPDRPEFALITRIHHRSEAFGLIADEGGINGLAVGIKYRF